MEKNRVVSVVEDNQPIAGCTVSKNLLSSGDRYAAVFLLAENTNISAEIYSDRKLIWALDGALEIFERVDCFDACSMKLLSGECALISTEVPVGFRSGCAGGVCDYAVYVEFGLGRTDMFKEIIKSGEVFRLADVLPYSGGRVVSMDLIDDKKLKFVVMSFDAGTWLGEHAAPNEALIFGLDGEGVVVYEGVEHTLKAGDYFKFEKGGAHSVRADRRFKMALFLPL